MCEEFVGYVGIGFNDMFNVVFLDVDSYMYDYVLWLFNNFVVEFEKV